MRRAVAGLLIPLLLAIPCATQAAKTKARARVAPPVVSHCGRHMVEVVHGDVRLDGQTLESGGEGDEIVVAPTWRRDCGAVAWIARIGTERFLVVVPSIASDAESIQWALPASTEDERIFWVGRKRITVGVATLQPHAMASWS